GLEGEDMNTSTTRVAAALVLAGLGGCAAPGMGAHEFWFGAPPPGSIIDVVAVRFGEGKRVIPAGEGDAIEARAGDTLYVKWRDAAGRMYEDTVDLRPLLPPGAAQQGIRVIASGPQLNVHVMNPVLRQIRLVDHRIMDEPPAAAEPGRCTRRPAIRPSGGSGV